MIVVLKNEFVANCWPQRAMNRILSQVELGCPTMPQC